ncbi:MAG: MFS transporter [Acidobacteria bacterium]|jgi:MFS transporter, SP family, arabinose:H+ symporter|nr:MAG: MFS transporter [Acidobacteriota bacterium]PYV86664.1 MAG: MFS transporter [Acidobacteriota bacterium]
MPGSINSVLLKSTAVAALGGLLFGFDTAVISGSTSALRTVFQLTPNLLGITVSSALWGTVAGSLLSSIPGERWGRRDSLRVLGVLYFLSALGCALAWNWPALLIFRIIGGLGIGGSSVLAPMYIAEIAPAKLRGRLVGFFQFNVVLGILVAYLSNYILGRLRLGQAEWRWDLGVAAIPAALFFMFLAGIPRSPRWLAKVQRLEEARSVLAQIGEPDPDAELADIVRSIDAEHGHANEPLFSRKYALPIFLAVATGLFNQLSGINAILYYLNDIFERAGFSKVSGDLQAVAVGATNLLFTMLAISVIDRFGRKFLLLVGSVGTSLSLAGVAVIFFKHRHEELLVWLLVSFIAFFAFSQGAVIWVYIGEVFPNRVRAKGQSLGSFSHWFANAIVSWRYPLMAASSGGWPFAFFSIMMALQFFVVLVVYPETRGVTLEEMQRRLKIA